ncbi:MAG: hypothetical protein K0R98_865 [Rickettsiaceae bacterium]|jgi:hypothetical protein|nr:hypothetical protein [Rickettsiaceae bacterium]
MKYILFIITAFFAQAAMAIDIGIPVACSYGEDCLIESYFDHDAKVDDFSDHTCGKLSADGHASTDFKLMNYEQMEDGVNVVAGDSGIVKQVRDGMVDVNVDLIGEEAIRGRECGNGVVIEHKRGYETQYCHLKQGSIVVKKDEKVEKGQMIGQVGLSGLTAFPSLEFTVRLNGRAVDPFTGEDPVSGDATVSCDSLDIYPLWDKQTEKKLKYISTALLSVGFSDKVPHEQGAREGKFSSKKIKDNARLLVLWVDIFGILKDDELKISILSPNGDIISSESRKFAGSKRQLFQFLGKKPESDTWPQGDYIGKVELLRKDNEEIEHVINASTTVDIVDANKLDQEMDETQSKVKSKSQSKKSDALGDEE